MSRGIGIEKQISLVKQQLQPADYLDQLMSFKYNIDHNRNSQLWSIDSFSGLSRCPYTSRCPWQSCNLVFKQQCYIRNIFAQFLLLAADAAILGLPCVPHRPIPSKCSAHYCRLQDGFFSFFADSALLSHVSQLVSYLVKYNFLSFSMFLSLFRT